MTIIEPIDSSTTFVWFAPHTLPQPTPHKPPVIGETRYATHGTKGSYSTRPPNTHILDKQRRRTPYLHHTPTQFYSAQRKSLIMPANLSQMIITSLLFIGGMRRARGDACTYFGAGSSICRLDVLHDVWLEKEQSNNNGQDYLIVGKEKGFSLKRSLLRFEMLDATHDCTTVSTRVIYPSIPLGSRSVRGSSIFATKQRPSVAPYGIGALRQ